METNAADTDPDSSVPAAEEAQEDRRKDSDASAGQEARPAGSRPPGAPRRHAPPPPRSDDGSSLILYDMDAPDRVLGWDELSGVRVTDRQMLWIDLEDPSPEVLDRASAARSLPPQVRESYDGGETNPEVAVCGDAFYVRAVAVRDDPSLDFRGTIVTLVACKNCVVSLHAQPVAFIDSLRAREGTQSDLGYLSSDSFVAAILDWQLSTYFEAVGRFEMAVERLENDILGEGERDSLPELRRLRRVASRMRRMLAPHRVVFGGLSRPDFRPLAGKDTDRHFLALDTRFERAMDMVENARDLVVGSFELFSSQVALVTNQNMRVLTFVTVVTGTLAVIAGILGMNFEASFFKTNDIGFWGSVAIMLLLGVVAVVVARRQKLL